MFENLTDRLSGIFEGLTRRGALKEDDVNAALREVRVALLEADVALPVVKDFITSIKERAVGHEVLKSITPGQQVVKIVHDGIEEIQQVSSVASFHDSVEKLLVLSRVNPVSLTADRQLDFGNFVSAEKYQCCAMQFCRVLLAHRTRSTILRAVQVSLTIFDSG